MAINVGTAVGYLELDTSKFTAGFKTAMSDLKTFGNNTATTSDKLTALSSSMGSIGSSMTKNVTLPLVGVGTAFVATASKFESSMSQVQATMGITKDTMTEVNGETVNAMDALSALAQKMGSETKFSASEAAEGLNYMALAGYSVETSIKMLPTVLNLAAAGAMELGSASDMVTDAQTALGLSLEETTIMVDQMAKTASSSNTSVAQLGEAILTIGGTAKFMAGGTEELNTVLGILADNGIKASEAGTHLRNMLLKLSSPTEDGAALIQQLGLQVYDTDGKMRKFADIFGDLKSAMSDFTDEEKVQAFSTLFNVRDVAAATALMDTTADRWVELEGKIVDSAGAAGQMADTQLDNLSGQLTILKSAVEGMAIAFGNLMLPAIKKVAEIIQNTVDWINNLSEEQKKLVVVIASVVAAIGPLLLVGSKLISTGLKIADLVKNIGVVTTALTGPIGIIIAAVAALALAWATDFAGIREFTGEFISKVVELFTVFKDKAQEIWNNNLGGIKTIIMTYVEIFETIFSGAFDIILAAMDLFIGIFTGDWEKVKKSVQSILNSIVGIVKGIGNSLFEAGKEIFGKLWDGLKDKWESIKSWVSEKVEWIKEKLKFWEDSADKMNSAETVSTGGSSRGNVYTTSNTNTTNTYNFYSPKALTPSESASALAKTQQKILLGF